MDEEKQSSTGEQRAEGDVWSELGQQFQSLGESLALAVRKTWESAESQRKLNEMRSGLENMVHSVDQAIRDTAGSPEGQRVREEAEKTAQSLRGVGEQTVQDVRPHLLNALQTLNEELQAFTHRMEKRTSSGSDDPGDAG